MGVRSPYRPGVTSGTKGQALRQIERQRCQDMGQQSGVFPLESRACCPVLPVSLLFVVALTGIERVWRQFRPVHLRLSVCKHVRPVRRWLRRNRHGSLAWHRGGTLVAPRGHVSRTGRARSRRRRAVVERCQPTTGALRPRPTDRDPRTWHSTSTRQRFVRVACYRTNIARFQGTAFTRSDLRRRPYFPDGDFAFPWPSFYWSGV